MLCYPGVVWCVSASARAQLVLTIVLETVEIFGLQIVLDLLTLFFFFGVLNLSNPEKSA